MSCGRVALQRAGIKVNNYFASEIDKYAIQVAMKNFPTTIQLGDITKVSVEVLDAKDISDLSDKIPRRELLHWLDKKLFVATLFGAQVSSKEREASENTTIPSYSKIRLYEKYDDGNISYLEFDGSGGERKKHDKRSEDIFKYTIWGDGDGQQKQKAKGEGFEGVNWQEDEPRNEGKIERGGEETISKPRSEKNGKCLWENGELKEVGKVSKITCIFGEFFLKGEVGIAISGSPCQGFSFAGKQLNFEDPRSKLFFEYVRLLKECKPKYFLLENVKMKKEYQDVISGHLGVEPVEIDSEIISAGYRKRLYWTNIPFNKTIQRKEISILDILEYPSTHALNVSSSMREGGVIERRCLISDKALTLTATGPSVKAATLIACTIGSSSDRVFRQTKKFGCLTASMFKGVRAAGRPIVGTPEIVGKHIDLVLKSDYRMLTPVECERIQTLEDNYTSGVSNTQRYKMLGNGWTVDVIAHILRGINRTKRPL